MPYKDPAKKKAADRAYHKANKEKRAAYQKVWYAVNREEKTARNRAWYAATREQRREVMRRWRDTNKEKKAAYSRKRKTGWDGEQYRSKLVEQDHRCAICEAPQCSSGKAFAADHDHVSGKPRGVLCGKCNKGLGLLGDNAAGVLKAAAYLLKYEVETKWEPITNEDTINTSATGNSKNIQPTHQRGGHDIRDVGGNDKQSDAAPEVAVGRRARQAA
jgi:hypothetical protein